MYVYLHSEPHLWTVGFYDPAGKFQPESDHDTAELAAVRVAFLNGGAVTPSPMPTFGRANVLPAKGATPARPAVPPGYQPSHLPRSGDHSS